MLSPKHPEGYTPGRHSRRKRQNLQLFTFPLTKDILVGVRLDDILKILKGEQLIFESQSGLQTGSIHEVGCPTPVFDFRRAFEKDLNNVPPARLLVIAFSNGTRFAIATTKIGKVIREKVTNEQKTLAKLGLPFLSYSDTIDSMPVYVFDLQSFEQHMGLPFKHSSVQSEKEKTQMTNDESRGLPKQDDPSADLLNQVGKTAREIQKILSMSDSMMDTMKMMETHLPQTSTGLEAVSKMTEEAAHKLLEGFEKSLETNRELREAVQRMKENPQTIQEDIKTVETLLSEDEERILHGFEAMVFQDLVGQNIRKMTGTLNDLQNKLLTILVELAPQPKHETQDAKGSTVSLEDLDLKGTGHPTDVNQTDVDKLLSEFGF
jgi:chemotaxis protein CheZ